MSIEVKPVSAAVVLLSGGLDSSTCLALAVRDGYQCHTLSFDYGQRHRAELDAARQLSAQLGAVAHRTVRLGLDDIGGSALTDPEVPVPVAAASGIPVTYVPARNTIFLAIALGYAEVTGADRIYAGMNAVDYSGYPDCRPEYLAAFQQLADLATKRGIEGHPVQVYTPLLHLSKAQIIQTGIELGVDFGATVSCYQANDLGEACGICDACRLRRAGFEAAGVADPTRYR